MASYPTAVEQLIEAFRQLPGVGRKTAERYTLYLIKQPPHITDQLSQRLATVRAEVRPCKICFHFSVNGVCAICSNTQRDHSTICVVADSSTVLALEQSGDYHGVYHVLGGSVNHLAGIGPEQLQIDALVQRIQRDQVSEIILATNPTISGEATALTVIKALQPLGVTISRLARGLPAGADIDYADDVTLGAALENRKPVI